MEKNEKEVSREKTKKLEETLSKQNRNELKNK